MATIKDAPARKEAEAAAVVDTEEMALRARYRRVETGLRRLHNRFLDLRDEYDAAELARESLEDRFDADTLYEVTSGGRAWALAHCIIDIGDSFELIPAGRKPMSRLSIEEQFEEITTRSALLSRSVELRDQIELATEEFGEVIRALAEIPETDLAAEEIRDRRTQPSEAVACAGCSYSDEPWHDELLRLLVQSPLEGVDVILDNDTEPEMSAAAAFIRYHNWPDTVLMENFAYRPTHRHHPLQHQESAEALTDNTVPMLPRPYDVPWAEDVLTSLARCGGSHPSCDEVLGPLVHDRRAASERWRGAPRAAPIARKLAGTLFT